MRQSTLAFLAAGWVATASTGSSGSVLASAFIQQYQSSESRCRALHSNTNIGSPRYVAVDRHFSHDIEDKSANSNQHPNPNHEQSLWVFVHSLQRERRDKGLQRQQHKPVQQKQREVASQTPKQKRYHPAKSLVVFLNNNRFQQEQEEDNGDTSTTTPQDVEPFSRAVVQGIRLASELGDYKLISSLVEASIQYANHHAIIMPRVFGEAIDGLAKTSANVNKLKQVWNFGAHPSTDQVLTEPLGTFELNVMIKAMASRGKIRAALDLYYESTATVIPNNNNHKEVSSQTQSSLIITPDPYTLSSIFAALQESILDDQATKPLQQPSESTIGLPTTEGENHSDTWPLSQCWQWNEAIHLFESYLVAQQNQQNEDENMLPSLNNHVFSNLLKLSDRVSQVYPTSVQHNGPKVALFLLHTMHQLNISPDIVTCTLVISNLGYQWKTALNLLYAMKTTPTNTHSNTNTEETVWQLPRPNVYTYSAVITNCAHCHQYKTAMELLQEMRHDKSIDPPNTWVYNAALLATTRSDSLNVLSAEPPLSLSQQPQHRSAPQQKRSRERLLMAMRLLREMEQEEASDCEPDTVSYNTVLSTLDGIASPMEPQSVNDELEEQFASFFRDDHTPQQFLSLNPRRQEEGEYFEEAALHRLLDEMEHSNIPRDSITYRNAVLAVRYSDNIRASVQRVLDRAVRDKDALLSTSSSSSSSSTRYVTDQVQDQRQPRRSSSTVGMRARQLDGKAADGVTFVFDTAMTVLSSRGDVDGVLSAYKQLMGRTMTQKSNAISDKIIAAQIHLIHALGHVQGGAATILLFLKAAKGDSIARLAVSKQYSSMDDKLLRYTPGNEALYSAAISSCLVANDIDSARTVLGMMREEGLKPSDLSLQEIARTYARLAVIAASEVSKKHTDDNKEQEHSAVEASGDSLSLALTRARNAYVIALKTVTDPPASLLSTIARTCASVGMWAEASNVLKLLHDRMTTSTHENRGSRGAAQAVLPGVHRALLRASSIQGNVTAALSFVDRIQRLSQRMSKSTARQEGEEEVLSYQSSDGAPDRQDTSIVPSHDSTQESLGMTAEDWKLLLIAASKSGHWRVCMSTLQFLRPYLEETHPSSLGITVEERSRRYAHIAPALTVALKCLEKRSQYGWAVRAIDDWIEWCGRRPPKEAVLAAMRILSKRGRGQEVNNLLARCTVGDGAALLSYSNDDSNYGLSLHVGAITALHKQGLYDDADDAFVAAVRGNFLPFDLHSEDFEGRRRLVLDLHGMNVPVARSAVRVAFQQEVAASWKDQPTAMEANESAGEGGNDIIIVTGRGRNSALNMRPVLRPEVQRMLVEEFYPPLSTASIPGNMGAVLVPAPDIHEWVSHQRRLKGSRMLAVANVLRNISSIDRLRQSIALKIQADEDRTESDDDAIEDER